MTRLAKLRAAYKKEGNGRVKIRMLAVIYVLDDGMTEAEAASHVKCKYDSVHSWVRRFRDDGIDGLYDRPKSGRRPLVDPAKRKKFMHKALAESHYRIRPVEMQQRLYWEFGVEYDVSYVRDLMHGADMSRKKSQHMHINRVSEEDLTRWQRSARSWISRAEADGYTVFWLDETIIKNDSVTGYKYWTYTDMRINVPYTGNHESVVVCGGPSNDGMCQMFCTNDEFTGRTALSFLYGLRRRFGKVAVLWDRATQHRTRAIQDMVESDDSVRMMYLPVGVPQLNPAEECWRITKNKVVNSTYHGSFGRLKTVLSNFLRRHKFRFKAKRFFQRPAKIILGTT